MGLFRCFPFFFCLSSLTTLRSFPSVGEAHCSCRRICSAASQSLGSPLLSQSCDVGSLAFTMAVLPVLNADLLLCLRRSRAPREVHSENRWKPSVEGPVSSRSSSGAFLLRLGSSASDPTCTSALFVLTKSLYSAGHALPTPSDAAKEPRARARHASLRTLKDHFICSVFNHLLRPCVFYIVKKSTPL